MRERADVIVIGGGIIGTAAAWYLAERGLQVTLLEKGDIACEQSSRNWGFVRQQGRDSREVSNRLWRGLETALAADLEWRAGGNLGLARNEREMDEHERWLTVAREHGLPTRVLSRAEVQALVPGMTGNWIGGLYTENDGQAEPTRVAPAFARAAARRGAEILTRHAALAIETAAGAVSGVLTEAGRIAAPAVLVAAGAWSARLLRKLGLSLPQLLVRATVARTTPVRELTACGVWGPDVSFRQRRDLTLNIAAAGDVDHDIVPDSFAHLRAYWPGYRLNPGMVSLRVGLPLLRALADRLAGEPGGVYLRQRVLDPPANPRRVARALSGLERTFPELGAVTVTRAWAGFIDLLPDAIPVIDALGQPRGLVLATGFSGHGFGMGPIAGRLCAELISEGRASLDISGFRYTRFEDGTPLLPHAAI